MDIFWNCTLLDWQAKYFDVSRAIYSHNCKMMVFIALVLHA